MNKEPYLIRKDTRGRFRFVKPIDIGQGVTYTGDNGSHIGKEYKTVRSLQKRLEQVAMNENGITFKFGDDISETEKWLLMGSYVRKSLEELTFHTVLETVNKKFNESYKDVPYPLLN